MKVYKIIFTPFKNRAWRLLLIAHFLLIGVACKDVQPNQIAGIWTMNDSSRSYLPTEMRNAKAKIVIDQNGTFVASDMPGLFYSPGLNSLQLDSGSGVWRLVSREGKQQLELDFDQVYRGKINLPYGMPLDVADSWSGLSLVYFLDDPDQGKEIRFEKSN